MKNFILLLSVFISVHAIADCRPQIDYRLEELNSRNSQTNQNLIVGGVLGGILVVAYAPVGIPLAGLALAGSGIHELSKSQLRKLKSAVDEAYVYNETGADGKQLRKLLKKVQRKIDNRIIMQDLVDAVIDSNHTEYLCRSKNLNQFSNRIEIILD